MKLFFKIRKTKENALIASRDKRRLAIAFNESSLKGLTLLEMVICVFILAIVGGILVGALIEAQALFNTADTTTMLQDEARLTISKLAYELKRATVASGGHAVSINKDTPFTGTDHLDFKKPNFSGNNVTVNAEDIDWNSSRIKIEVDANKGLTWQQTGQPEVIASHVKKVNFSLDTTYPDQLTITLELQRTGPPQNKVYSLTVTDVIYIRN